MTDQELAARYKEASKHLPNLFELVPLIAHKNEDGKEMAGSGVYLRLGNHHFIGTAKHCIENDPRIITAKNFKSSLNMVLNPIHVPFLKKGMHDSLDIGYLEIQNPEKPEIERHQLFFDPIPDGKDGEGFVHIVGYPFCERKNNSDGSVTIVRTAFGTRIIKQDEKKLSFEFPKTGVTLAADKTWVSAPFIPHPGGFSGGGCFGLANLKKGEIEFVEYKLIGIQFSWNEKNAVNVVPIKRLYELIQRDYGLPD